MYDDPKHLRDHEVKVRLDEETYELLKALANYNRQQKSVFARNLLIAELERLIKENADKEKDAKRA